MDIHRCRFVPYSPSTINALAFSHPSSAHRQSKIPDTLRLAVGRANGDIEIWNPLGGAWSQETILKGGKDRSIEGLVWTQDTDGEDENGNPVPGRLRLFSIGYSTYVTEWDLALGRPARHSSGNYGEVWCLTAQPRRGGTTTNASRDAKQSRDDRGHQGQELAIGCADGAVVLLSTADGDLSFKKALSRPSAKKARVLSIAYQGSDIIVVGCADSTIRILDARNGKTIRNMSLGGGPSGGPREILVWSVRCLPGGQIVSGDSTGEVRFWDGKTYTLVQRLKSHQADVLDVETSADGQTVVSGGIDRRTTVYKRTKGAKVHGSARWEVISHQRLHTHDVKTMAAFEAKNLSVVASGGVDTNLVISPLREFGKENHRTLASLPQEPAVQSVPRKRLLMSWWDREVRIWYIPGPISGGSAVQRSRDLSGTQKRALVSRIGLKGEESITSASISANGSLLAVSTMSEVKVFRLRQRRTEDIPTLQVRKLEVPATLATQGARLMQFSPDSKWLCIVTPGSIILMARVAGDEHHEVKWRLLPKLVELKRRHRKPAALQKQQGVSTLGPYERNITRIAFSTDGRILVCGDLAGRLDSWVLEGHEDLMLDGGGEEADEDGTSSSTSSAEEDDERPHRKRRTLFYGQHWAENPSGSLLPKLPAAPLILSFRPENPAAKHPPTNGNIGLHATRHTPHPLSHVLPGGEDRLLVMTSLHQVFEFEVLKGSLTAWSRKNDTASLPREFRSVRDRAMGCIWDISSAVERVWLYGSGWLFMFDLSQDFPVAILKEGGKATDNQRKRKRGGQDDNSMRWLQREEDLRKDTSGAGSKIPDSDIATGISREVRKITQSGGETVLLEAPRVQGSDDEKGTEAMALSKLRRGIKDAPNQWETDGKQQTGGGEALIKDSRAVQTRKPPARGRPGIWSTFKYRPIMGIVPIGLAAYEASYVTRPADVAGQEAERMPEVVLVERPAWDIDLPLRFYGDQEWAENKAALSS